jgi:glycine dehydrogenase subunit 2
MHIQDKHGSDSQSMDFMSRKVPLLWEERSELDVMRHMMFLAGRNFSIDQQFYPLGSCTMKYNPRIAHRLTMLPQLAQLHPLLPSEEIQGVLECLWELQGMLGVVTGLPHVTLAPMAAAHGKPESSRCPTTHPAHQP